MLPVFANVEPLIKVRFNYHLDLLNITIVLLSQNYHNKRSEAAEGVQDWSDHLMRALI